VELEIIKINPKSPNAIHNILSKQIHKQAKKKKKNPSRYGTVLLCHHQRRPFLQ
jgi:hypothetical protein